jgi:serine/threonine protein kinase/tetratricopeptide (TPR) repeat protein
MHWGLLLLLPRYENQVKTTMTEKRYRLERQLGAGGMGDVWLATDTLLNRPVAVKYLQAKENTRFKDWFITEAQTLASLQHPNITLIYDAVLDEEQNIFHIIMEYVEGLPLSALIEEHNGPLPLDTVFEVAIGILTALQYAHNKGFVHRDIKPDNVIIQPDSVKLTDFGLAVLVSKLAEADDQLIIGTPAYMAPEVIAGESVDYRADLYALGVTLFEMVTGGRHPFEVEYGPDLMLAHIEQPPPSVRDFEPTVPLQLERIIDRLLSKFPDQRFESAQALLDILEAMRARQKFNQRHLGSDARPMVGRQELMTRLQSVWSEVAESGKPRLVLVSGEPGIGRSRLVVEFLGHGLVEQGTPVAIARCDELGTRYSPYAEILATIFEKGLVKPATIQQQINYLTDQLPTLAPLLNIEEPTALKKPVASGGLWQTLSRRLPATPVVDPSSAQQKFFTTVLTIFLQMGAGALFFENGDLLDEDSAELTRFLRHQTQLPLLFVVEIKKLETPPAWLSLFDPEEWEIIPVEPLASAEVKSMLAYVLDGQVSDSIVRIVERRSRGIPLQIEEVTRHLVDTGEFYRGEAGGWEYLPPPMTGDLSQSLLPFSLAHAFSRQIEKLSKSTREFLTVAAMLEPGAEFEFQTWLQLPSGPLTEEIANNVIDEALQRRIIRATAPGRYLFRPADIDAVLTAALEPARRQKLHLEIAETLRQHNGTAILIGYHYEQAGRPEQAAQYLEEAGAEAFRNQATHQAVDFYKRAVGLVETATAYEVLGTLYRQQGSWDQSIAALKRALELTNATDTERQARVLNSLAFSFWLADNYREAAKHASAVLKLSGVSVTEQATAQTHLGMITWLLGHLTQAEEWCHKAVCNLENGPERSRLAEAYNRLGLVLFTTGRFKQATEVTNHSLQLRRELGEQWGEAYCLVGLGQLETEQGQFQAAGKSFETAEKLFKEIESSDGLMVVHTEHGRMLLLQNEVEQAVFLLKKALKLAREIKKSRAYGLAEIYLLIAQASINLDDLSRAWNMAEDALKLVEPAGNRRSVAMAHATLAQIQAASGKREQAEQMFEQALTRLTEIGYPAGLLRTRLEYAKFLHNQGQTRRATAVENETRLEADRIGLYL